MAEALWIGLALLLVFEGMMPFINPESARRMYAMMAAQSNQSLRTAGLIAMVIGLIILYLVR